ncbi:MAG: VWA domain-containing protein [Acidobacteria bacterium]|nr:VWA domain-containing protein [Acidobacteriota bacterium]
MQFAVALPWWGYVLACAIALACAWWTYARLVVPLTGLQRSTLTALRAVTLLLLVLFLLRPVQFVQAVGARDSIVAILVDGSRSMRLADAGGPRLERARAVAKELQPAIGADFRTELLTFGESLARGEVGQLTADARRSDLTGALTALADRYRGQRLAGVVVLSDGGDTAAREAGTSQGPGVPVFTVGIGETTAGRDREVVNLTAGDPMFSDSSIDLSVSATSAGFGTTAMELRLSANGRPIETRHVASPEDGAPIHEVFTVSPAADQPTV